MSRTQDLIIGLLGANRGRKFTIAEIASLLSDTYGEPFSRRRVRSSIRSLWFTGLVRREWQLDGRGARVFVFCLP
jgi:hypothetical protein